MSKRFLPYGRQQVDQADIDAVISVLKSDWLTQGPQVERFEGKLSALVGAKHAVAVSNGTAALHLAAVALGVERRSVGITAAMTFAASGNCIAYAGGDVVFADIDPRSGLMDLDALEREVNALVNAGRAPALIVPVHFAGEPVAMARVARIARSCGARVLEDAAHALGASYSVGGQSYKVGACAHSDAVTFSFHPVKHVTTAEGGAIVTNDDTLAATLRSLRSHGIVKDPTQLERPATDPFFGPWYYEQQQLGYNYRLSDLHSALGSSQLDKLEAFVTRRRAIAHRYDRAFSEAPLCQTFTPLSRSAENKSSFHLYVVQLGPDQDRVRLAARRRDLFEFLRKEQIGVQVHYLPVPWLPYYARQGQPSFAGAEAYYAASISLPIFPAMRDADVDRVLETLASWRG